MDFIFLLLLILLQVAPSILAGDPQFDPSTLMKLVLVPADAAVGSVIYRLRATDIDFDYPLQFELLDEAAKTIIKVETLPCSRYNSVCQANIVLLRRLEAGRFYDFRVRIRDTKGGTSTISCSITATNSTTPRDVIFPHVPELIMVPEDAKRGTELGYIVARKNPSYPKPAYLELWGSPLFAIRQRAISDENTEGTIFLLGPLDYEKQAMYHLTVLANDAFGISKYDTRNIAGVQIVVVVQDVQDQPPIFTEAPPVTQLDNSLVPGDIIVRVHAEDGDKGSPRQIQYGLVSEGNPFTPFFNISEKGGEIILVRPLDEITAISHPGVPILLTVVAEEIKTSRDEPPAMSSTVQLALILGERGNQPPYFENDNYVSKIEENAIQGTALIFSDPYDPQVSDDDMGKNGVFSLTLENNNGTFEISPTVGERRTQFLIKVRDNSYLDYEERQTVQFRIIAQELGPATNLSATTDVIVNIIDVNDNPPVFLQESYLIALPENVTAGTRVVQIIAEDVDTGLFGKVRYTQILGHMNTSLNLDPVTGIITIASDNHGLDREMQEEYHFYVEARDEDGEGNRATVLLVIKLLDVNDNPPIFEKSLYEFILSPDLRNFTNPAIIHATDMDTDYPNNAIRYEIIQGNFEDKFFIIPDTGELLLKQQLKPNRSKRETRQASPEVYILIARAYDLGVPHLSSNCEIRVYPPESRARTMMFIVAGTDPDRYRTEEVLSAITGGRVTIQSIRPYNGREIGATDVSTGDPNSDKSVVVATVLYNSNTVVDVSHLQNNLNKSSSGVIHGEDHIVREYHQSDSSGLLFWLLLLLAFLILALIILLLCCLCQGCPFYTPLKRAIHSQSVAENVHLVHEEKILGHHENKSVQAVEWGGRNTRKEAWSADIADTRTKATQWQFNRRNQQKPKDTLSLRGYDNGSVKDIRTAPNHDEKSTLRLRDEPNVIYTRDWQNRKENNMYIEDMDGDFTSVSRLEAKHPEEYDGESLQRHEIERGSDKGNSFRKQNRELFIREGNTEILRLVTRGRPEQEGADQRPVTLVQAAPPTQYIMVDNGGKEILMQRYIEQQSILNPNLLIKSNPPSVITQNYEGIVVPPPVAAPSNTPSREVQILEESFRQQNELLRQILLEKEKMRQDEVMKFETQSLPGNHFVMIGTQTDCNTSTQTDLDNLRPDRRKTRSDNDSVSEDESQLNESDSDNNEYKIYIIDRANDRGNSIRLLKRRKYYKKRKSRIKLDQNRKVIKVVEEMKRKIKTPILEEIESSPQHFVKSDGSRSASGIRKEVLLEISDSLEDQIVPSIKRRRERLLKQLEMEEREKYSDDSLNEQLSEPVEKTSNEEVRDNLENHSKSKSFENQKSSTSFEVLDSEVDKKPPKIPPKPVRNSKIRENSKSKPRPEERKKVEPAPDRSKSAAVDDKKVDVSKSVPRYMQWYKNKKERDKQLREEGLNMKPKLKPKIIKKPIETETPKAGSEPPQEPVQGRPLLQHSEHRYEHMYPHPQLVYAQPAQIPQHMYMQATPISQVPPPIIIQPSPHHVNHSSPHRQNEEVRNGRIEEDYDSGIAMTSLQNVPPGAHLKKLPITEKKSVFTIAYDDMHTKQLTADTPPY